MPRHPPPRCHGDHGTRPHAAGEDLKGIVDDLYRMPMMILLALASLLRLTQSSADAPFIYPLS